jgi:hypothetical protein
MNEKEVVQKYQDARNALSILLNKLPIGEAVAMAKIQCHYWGRMKELLLKKELE